MITYEIDVLMGDDKTSKCLAVKRGDTGICLRVNLKQCVKLSKYRIGETPYNMPIGSCAVLIINKSDGRYVLQDGEASGSVVTFRCTSQAFTATGKSNAEISVLGADGRKVTSGTFCIDVLPKVDDGSTEDSEPYADILAEQRRAVEDAAKRAEEAADRAEEATGDVAPEVIEEAVKKYLDDNPVTPSAGGGLPEGGKAGQYLRKKSDADGDVEWADMEIPKEYGRVTYDQNKTITIR